MLRLENPGVDGIADYEKLADPALKGKICIRSSSNVYNLSLMSSMIAAHGAEKAEAWGLIWKAVDDEFLIPEAEKLCAHFATAPTIGLGLIKKALIVPERISLSEVLQQFRQAFEDFAVILNEYSLVVGIITINDVMSTVMGSLVAPMDDEQIVQRDADSWLIDGATPIPDVLRALDLDQLPQQDSGARVALSEAKAAFDAGEAIFLDVRTSQYYQQAHIPGALNIPLDELEARLGELQPGRWIITYCT